MSFRTTQSKSPFVRRIALALSAVLVAAACTPLLAQQPVPFSARYHDNAVKSPTKLVTVPGTLVIPASSRTNAADKGKRAHTNFRYIVPVGSSPADIPAYGYGYETPASLACIYQLVTPVAGCNPNAVTAVPNGGGGTIAIVDAYHDPAAYGDLAYFSDEFGIPLKPSMFQVVFASGSEPPVDSTGGWEMEEALDIEYAHAMAPNAMLYLVEANSNSNEDLFAAVTVATNLVICGNKTCPKGGNGKGEVSMSWGGEEAAGQLNFDKTLKAVSNVVYFASSGDSAGVIYPSTSPYVVAVGGTSTARSLATGNLLSEITWSEGGGGLSSFETAPAYQSGITAINQGARSVPDISADANPNTGAWVYDSFPSDGYYYSSNWWWVGGTSLASPMIAGIVNASEAKSGKWATSTTAELTALYSLLAVANKTAYGNDFNDITYGACNYYSGSFAVTGYDLCTGIGSPKGLAGK
jgi:subtilase family serine protease